MHAATRSAPSLRTVAPHVPVRIAAAIDRALAFEKQDRWPSALAMHQALANSATLDEGDDEEKTQIAPPPDMTLHDGGTLPLRVERETATVALPTLPVASTVAGVSATNAPLVKRGTEGPSSPSRPGQSAYRPGSHSL